MSEEWTIAHRNETSVVNWLKLRQFEPIIPKHLISEAGHTSIMLQCITCDGMICIVRQIFSDVMSSKINGSTQVKKPLIWIGSFLCTSLSDYDCDLFLTTVAPPMIIPTFNRQ